MNRLTFSHGLAMTLALCLGLTACSSLHQSSGKADAAFAPPDQLTGVLTNGDVLLHWKNNATADGGNWVEFSTPGSEYTKLAVFLNEAPSTEFIHPRVAPETDFIYHIQPF